jgi:hypothetical protein
MTEEIQRMNGAVTMKLISGFGAAFLVAGALALSVRPQAQENDDRDQQGVTEAEIELYIDVYSAMQKDHDITIDSAIASHNVSLEQFRDVERRVQRDQRMVDRVREALLETAKARAVDAVPTKRAGPSEQAQP